MIFAAKVQPTIQNIVSKIIPSYGHVSRSSLWHPIVSASIQTAQLDGRIIDSRLAVRGYDAQTISKSALSSRPLLIHSEGKSTACFTSLGVPAFAENHLEPCEACKRTRQDWHRCLHKSLIDFSNNSAEIARNSADKCEGPEKQRAYQMKKESRITRNAYCSAAV